MRSRRWLVPGALALVLSLVAAGCGGDGGSKKSGGGNGKSEVKGTISMIAVWTGPEGQAIQAVLNGFKQKNPKVTVKYKSAKDPGQVITTAVQGGNPPDIAALPSPGLMKGFVGQGALKPIDFAKSDISNNFSADWLKFGTVNGKLYGLFFKGANKSTVWYNVHAFKDAGIEAPSTWPDFLNAAKTLKQSGVPAYSLGASDGWVLTDLFENIYLRSAGPEKYDQLTTHQIPWTDPSVTKALTEMAKVIGDKGNLAGGTTGALQTDFATSVANAFKKPPQGAMVIEGDFVAGVAQSDANAKPQTDFDFFDFPSIDNSGKFVMGGGDMVVMFKNNPASRAFLEYLATPEAAEIWAKRGGFSSPNKNVSEDAYPDDITRRSATALANADSFVFDMSDLAPGQFGSADEWTLLQGFFKNPDDVDGAAAKLEAAAKKAYAGS